MVIALGQLFVCEPAPPNSLQHFVDFWAARYSFSNPEVYTQNIKGPHTEAGLKKLFAWKIGPQYPQHLARAEKQFIARRDKAAKLSEELVGCEPGAAKSFLDYFNEGGPIYRIFWLHCWNQGFPIYDQHVHRAMTYIRDGKAQELVKVYGEEQKIAVYLTRYLPFFAEFQAIPDRDFAGVLNRKVDMALWQFGKSLKKSNRDEREPEAAAKSTH